MNAIETSPPLVDGIGGSLSFALPRELEAAEPPEVRGTARDDVRLMVSDLSSGAIEHRSFNELPDVLAPGDVIVVNTSGTLAASLPARSVDGDQLQLHLSTRLPGGFWIVELRQPAERATLPYRQGVAGQSLELPEGARARLLSPYPAGVRVDDVEVHDKSSKLGSRLWLATVDIPGSLVDYLTRVGRPIRYGYVDREWSIDYYQTVFATEPGSAEMPSAGRPFTAELVTRLVSRGISIAPIVLHTGVASLEEHEPPYEEYYRVSGPTARLVNATHAGGGRVIAVGTTVVRALESSTDEEGVVHPSEGWTSLVITPDRRMRAVDGLLTGLHEPRATHLAMLSALAGVDHLRHAYGEALRHGYLWHEFGDLHLMKKD